MSFYLHTILLTSHTVWVSFFRNVSHYWMLGWVVHLTLPPCKHSATSYELSNTHPTSAIVLRLLVLILHLLILLILKALATSVGLANILAWILSDKVVILLRQLLLLFVLLLFDTYLIALDHWYQNGMSLPYLSKFFRCFNVCIVKWIFPFKVWKHLLISDWKILHFLREGEYGLLHLVFLKLP